VSYGDLNGVEHTVEVTADSLYEAVAQGLRVFREKRFQLLSATRRFSTRSAFRILNGGSNRKGGILPR
jgi:hypothetical protein